MRKIEQQMCAAVQSNKNWQSANTSVHFDEESGVSVVRLHGNKIAEIDDTSMTIFDGGWQTNTTKSRLNALCDEFCIAGEGVFQKNYKWFVRKFTGAINGKNVFVTEEFDNGYIFAWYVMLKKTVIRVVGDTANRIDSKMTRLEKFEVFCRVCDNLLDDGRITKAQHSSWTNIF